MLKKCTIIPSSRPKVLVEQQRRLCAIQNMINELSGFAKSLFSRKNLRPSAFLSLMLFGILTLRALGGSGAGLFVAKYLGYWLCLALVFVFSYELVITFLRKSQRFRLQGLHHAKTLGFSFALGSLWLIHEPWVDRVLFDEYVFLGISHQMHQAREAMNPAKAHLIDNAVRILANVPDKRSYLFPFFASVLHDVTGFRPQNLFLVNVVFGLGVLPLAYAVLSVLFSPRTAIIGVILWAAFGLLPAHMNGAGYEIVNLFFLQLWLLLAVLSVKGSSARWWDLFVISSICLALLRNESVFFLVGTALIGVVRYQIRGFVRISWPMAVAALALFVPVAANLNFSSLDGLRENTQGQLFFALSYLPENFLWSLHFVLNPALKAPNQPLIGVLGLLAGTLFLVRYLGRCSRGEAISARERVLFVFSGCIGLCYILYMCTFWGNWNDPMVSRFSISSYFWLLVMTCWLLEWASSRVALRQARKFAVLGASIFAFARLPAHTQLEYTRRFQVGWEMEFLKTKLAERHDSRVFLVTNGISGFISRGIAGVWATGFGAQPWRVQTLIDYKLYDEILIAERFVFDSAKGTWRPDRMQPEPDEISWYYGGKYDVELIEEYFSTWSSCLRIYRVKAVVDVAGARKRRDDYIRENDLGDKDHVIRLLHLLP
jgi:hypothetical protein